MNEKSNKQCAKCGSCTVVCPVFRVTGRETLVARGKLHLLSTELSEKPSSHFQDLFAQCLLCGACEDNCSRQLPILEQIVAARSTFPHFYGKNPLQRVLAREVLSRPALLEGLVKTGLSLSKLDLLPRDSGLRLKLGLLKESSQTVQIEGESASKSIRRGSTEPSYFTGCMARYLQPSIAESTSALAEELTSSKMYKPDSQICCGLAAWSAGKLDEARRLARKNIEAFAENSGPILTSCASCSSQLQKYPALFADDPKWQARAVQFADRVREFTSFILENLEGRRLKGNNFEQVHYHEPCHLRFGGEKNKAAWTLLAEAENVELVNRETESCCCGQGGLFHLGYPELSEKIFARAYDLANSGGADIVVTSCSGCLMQWQAGLARCRSEIKAVHFAQWLARNLQINS